MTLIVEIPAHLSHSQADNLVGSYCPASQFFSRVLGKPERPGWAMIGGSALHTATEEWDLGLLREGDADASPSRLAELFNAALDNEILRTEEKTVYPREEWHRAGRQGTRVTDSGGPNKKDEGWWRERGPLMLHLWTTWRMNQSWEIADIDGITGIEVPFRVEIAGTEVVGYIDRVFETTIAGEHQYLVVDLKSGKEPDSTAQLGTYREGLQKQYGINPKWGAYWLGGSGLSTMFTDLPAKWPTARVERRFAAARRRQLAGEFDPKPSNLCGSCGVKEFCAEYGGEKAAQTPQPWDITEVRIAAPAESFRA